MIPLSEKNGLKSASTTLTPSLKSAPVGVRQATLADVPALVLLEQQCFSTDRLTARRFKHYVTSQQAVLLVATSAPPSMLVGYALLLLRRGTQLTRLYSIAVSPEARGSGVAARLITALEEQALQRGKPFMRLEVSIDNKGAIALYDRLGFSPFGMYEDYYGDHSDALRIQKRLTSDIKIRQDIYPWYQQTTPFTCGPASLMMALKQLRKSTEMNQRMELDIWRVATTIYMTSGHGGCHPIGLGLAAIHQGFNARVLISHALPLFVDGVRSAHKKAVIAHVEEDFYRQAQDKSMPVDIGAWHLDGIDHALTANRAVLCLISTYAFDKKKAPHWVVITGADSLCFYLHDPDADTHNKMEFQHIPIAKEDFLRLATYGSKKISALVIIDAKPF